MSDGYSRPYYVGEDGQIGCEVVTADGSPVIITAGELTIADAAGTVLVDVDSTDLRFTIAGQRLAYQWDIDADTHEPGMYTLCWSWTTSNGQTYKSRMRVRVAPCIGIE